MMELDVLEPIHHRAQPVWHDGDLAIDLDDGSSTS